MNDRLRGSARLFVLLMFLPLAACAADTADDVETADHALTAREAPTSVPMSSVTQGGALVYEKPTTAQRGWFKDYVLFEVEGTVGDEVEIVVDAPGDDPYVVVLGDGDPAKIAECERWRALSPSYADSCRSFIPYSVVAFADDESATSKRARLRTTLTSPKLRIAAAGAEWLTVTATSVRSALDTTACRPGSPAPGSIGPIVAVTRGRDCVGATCTPWRELSRRKRVPTGKVTGTKWSTLWLTDSAGTFRTFADGMVGRTPCTADTYCSVSRGAVACSPYETAVILDHGSLDLDSQTCTSNHVGTPRLRGTIGERCLSLSAGVTRTSTATGARETETVFVADW